MARETLLEIIHNFSPEEFIHFFRLKNRSFRPYTEPAPEYDDDQFTDALFLGEIPFNETDKVVIYSFLPVIILKQPPPLVNPPVLTIHPGR